MSVKPQFKPPGLAPKTPGEQEIVRQIDLLYGVGVVVPDNESGHVMVRHNRATNKLQYSLDGKVWADY